MKLEHLPRLVLSVAGAAVIGAACFTAGNVHGYQTATENAATVAAQELAATENESYYNGYTYGFNSGYDSGYSAGETAATEEYTLNGWMLDSLTAPNGTELYCITDMETGCGYAIFVARDDGLEEMTSETPTP